MIHWTLNNVAGLATDQVALAGFLADAEQRYLDSLRVPKRRQEFVLGRATAKALVQNLVAEEHGSWIAPNRVCIERSQDGAPEVIWLDGPNQAAAQVSLSISHSRGMSLCALSADPGVKVGADIEHIEPRAESFLCDYFTDAERAAVAAAAPELRDELVTTIWSAKEAVLKVVRLGLSVDTRRVTCLPAPRAQGWSGLSIQTDLLAAEAGQGLAGYWRRWGDYSLTIAVAGDSLRTQAPKRAVNHANWLRSRLVDSPEAVYG